ncbi:hypothetical protein EK904_001666 [Melospiza melodia maxima]|nr:hypothetical protein EK904_001666 [Melospiza melodia maxima]
MVPCSTVLPGPALHGVVEDRNHQPPSEWKRKLVRSTLLYAGGGRGYTTIVCPRTDLIRVSNSAKWSHTSATPQSGQSLFTNTAFSKCSEILMMPHHTKDVLLPPPANQITRQQRKEKRVFEQAQGVKEEGRVTAQTLPSKAWREALYRSTLEKRQGRAFSLDHPTCTVRAYLQYSNCYILPFIIVHVILPVSCIGMTWILVYMDGWMYTKGYTLAT